MGVSYSIGYTKKAVNSTSRSYTAAVSGSAFIKEPCDFRNPIIQVSGAPGNYTYMEMNSAYYWVDKVVSFPNGVIEVHAHLDPLATYQDEIAGTKAYVLYSSLGHNVEADDPRMNPEVVAPKSVISASDIFGSAPTPTGGSVIVTAFESGLGTSNQGVKTYALTLSSFASMLVNLQSSLYDSQFNTSNVRTSITNELPNWTDPDQVFNVIGALGSVAIHDIVKALSDLVSRIGGYGSWRDNLIKAIYVPFAVADIPGNGSKNIHFGFLDTGVSGKLCDPVYVKTKTSSVQIPWDGRCTTYHFLKYPRFQQFQAVCCGGQCANIDSNLIRDLGAGDSLAVHTAVDVMSGDWSAVLAKDSAKNSLRLATFGGNLGIEISGLAGKGGLGMGMNYTLGGINMAANAMSFGAVSAGSGTADSVMNITSGIASRYIQTGSSVTPSGIAGNGISSIFLNGSTGYNDLSITGQLTFPAIIDGIAGANYDSYCQKYGYPYNAVADLALDGSYVICSGAFVKCKGSQQDQAYINSVLNSGILLEA